MMTVRKAQPMNALERSIRGDIERLREYYAGLMAGTTRWRETMRRHLGIYASRARQLGVLMPSRFGNAPAALTDLFNLLAKANRAQADHGGQPIALPNHAVILRRILGVGAMGDLGSRHRRVAEKIGQVESDREKKRASLKVQAKERGARGRRAQRQLRRMARQDRRMRQMERRMEKKRAKLEKRARGRGVGAKVAKRLLQRGDRVRQRVKEARAGARKKVHKDTSGAATTVTEQLARRRQQLARHRQQLARVEEGRVALARTRAAATRGTRPFWDED